jgi:hypothetical protein
VRCVLAITESVGHSLFRHFLDPKPESYQALAPGSLHLVVTKNVWNRKFMRKSKESLQQASSLQIDQHGCHRLSAG